MKKIRVIVKTTDDTDAKFEVKKRVTRYLF